MADNNGNLKKAGHAVSTTVPRRKKLLEGVDLDEDRDVVEQLTEILSKKAVKVMDLFREWDLDGAATTPAVTRSLPRETCDRFFLT